MKNGFDSNDPHKNPMSGPNLSKEPKSDRKSLENPHPNKIANHDPSVLITDNPILCDEDRGAVAASESIISSKLDKNQEVSKDHGLLLGLSESQALNQAFLDPESSSRVSLFQNEPFATENLQNRIDSDSFFQELDRFKKNFKKTFEDDSSPPSASENANKNDIFRYNLIHPSQHFGIDSFSSKPNSLAVNLLQNKKNIKSGSQRSSSISLYSSPEGITSQSTVKRRGNPLFMLKNLYSRPGLKKKQAMVLNIGLNGNTDIGYNTGITSNGENDCVQSLDTSYDNNLKDLEEDYVETVGYDKIVSYDTDQEKCLKSQETFSYMQTDNSVLRTKNVVEVLEHIENQNPVVVDSTKAQFSSTSGFESLLERLENRHKQKNRQSAFFENDSLLRRINVSAYDISIDSNMKMNNKASSQMTLLRNESSFVTKYDLRLEVDSQNQQATEDDRVATEGNDTLSNFDLDINLNDLNQSFMNSSNCNSKQIRRVQVRKHERHKSQQDPNHSCVLPQTDPLKIVHHKTRIYKPFIRPREQKLTTAWSQQYSAKEIIKVSDEKEAENSLNNSLGNVGLPQKNNTRCIRNKPGRSLKEYLAFNLKADQDGHERPLSRQKKAIIRNVQLDMCYGQLLKVGTQERGKKK